MKRSFHVLAAILVALCAAHSASAQSSPYPSADLLKTYERLLDKINSIPPLYDNHAHPGFA
jgi:hypothetical protein